MAASSRAGHVAFNVVVGVLCLVLGAWLSLDRLGAAPAAVAVTMVAGFAVGFLLFTFPPPRRAVAQLLLLGALVVFVVLIGLKGTVGPVYLGWLLAFAAGGLAAGALPPRPQVVARQRGAARSAKV